jgi:hypothetical protein
VRGGRGAGQRKRGDHPGARGDEPAHGCHAQGLAASRSAVAHDGAVGDPRRPRSHDRERRGGSEGQQDGPGRGVGQRKQGGPGERRQALLPQAGLAVPRLDPGPPDRLGPVLRGAQEALAQPLAGLVHEDTGGAAAGAEIPGDALDGAALDLGEPQGTQPALRKLAQHGGHLSDLPHTPLGAGPSGVRSREVGGEQAGGLPKLPGDIVDALAGAETPPDAEAGFGHEVLGLRSVAGQGARVGEQTGVVVLVEPGVRVECDAISGGHGGVPRVCGADRAVTRAELRR